TDGALYGTSPLGGSTDSGTVFRIARDGSGYGVVHDFAFGAGNLPTGLVEARDGTLFGTTQYGGRASGGNHPEGTVFKLNRDGTGFATVRDFGLTAEDGRSPTGLIQGSDRTLYGQPPEAAAGDLASSSNWPQTGAATPYCTNLAVLTRMVGTPCLP